MGALRVAIPGLQVINAGAQSGTTITLDVAYGRVVDLHIEVASQERRLDGAVAAEVANRSYGSILA